MEWGLLHDFFGNFSTRGERYYFGWRVAREVRICMRGENVYMRCTRGDFQWWRRGENMYARWECVCKVTLNGGGDTWGENMYTRWECVHEMTLNGGGDTRGENMYVRWECVCEVRTCVRGDFEWWRGACKVRTCTRGENVYARWLWMVEGTCEVRICTWGENVYARWEHACEVTLRGGGDNSTLTLKVTSRGHEVTFLYSIDVTSVMTKLEMMKIPRVWPYIVQSHLAWGRETTLR